MNQGTFVYFNDEKVKQNNLKLAEICVYSFIRNYTKVGKPCFISPEKIEKFLNICKSSVYTHLNTLIRKKLIYCVQKNDKKYFYALLEEKDTPRSIASDVELDVPVVPPIDASQPIGIIKNSKFWNDDSRIWNINNNINNNKYNTPFTPQASQKKLQTQNRERDFCVDNKNFEIAFSEYPRKDAKEAARKIWHKLSQTGELSKIGDVLKAIKFQKETKESWQRDNGRYIPYFVNWLQDLRFTETQAESYLSEQEQKEIEQSRARKKFLEEQEKQRREKHQEELANLRKSFDKFCSLQSAQLKENLNGFAFSLWSKMLQKRKKCHFCKKNLQKNKE